MRVGDVWGLPPGAARRWAAAWFAIVATALALRLAEALFLKEERGEEPILLLDDVLSELDPQRRQHVLEEAGRYQQTLVTTAEPALISDAPVPPSAAFTVEKGQVRPSER